MKDNCQFFLALGWHDTALYLILVPEDMKKLPTAEERKKNDEDVERQAVLIKGERKRFG